MSEPDGSGAPLEELRAGGKRALSMMLAAVEARPGDQEMVGLLDAAFRTPHGHVLGLTGPPGVGKSTLVNELVVRWRTRGLSVGVIAVDPSSRRTGGALLGDRTRIVTDPDDHGVFIRSMAARDRLGGLATLTVPAMVLMRAIFDIVIIETVGVGQSEADIAKVADTVIFCVQPESGDSLQFMKAGIMEIPDIAAVTKADLGASALRAVVDVEGALSLAAAADGQWPVKVLPVSAKSGDGVDRLMDAVGEHWQWLSSDDKLVESRHARAKNWLEDAVLLQFGEDGIDRARAHLELDFGESPFSRQHEIARLISSNRQ